MTRVLLQGADRVRFLPVEFISKVEANIGFRSKQIRGNHEIK
jgi:hypothetical protein